MSEKRGPLPGQGPTKCVICLKTVYPMDGPLNLDGTIFHKQCAKCKDCNCQITLNNFHKSNVGGETLLLCKTHFFSRFNESNSYLGDDKFARKATSNSSTTPAKTLSVVEKAKMSLADPEQARKQREAEEKARDAQIAARKAEYNPDPAPTPGKLKSLRDVYEKGSSSETKPKSPGPSALAAWSASIFGANQRSPPISPLQKISKTLSTRTAGSVAENVSYITESGGSEVDGIKKIGQPMKSKYADFINNGKQPSSSSYTPAPIPNKEPPGYTQTKPQTYLPPPIISAVSSPRSSVVKTMSSPKAISSEIQKRSTPFTKSTPSKSTDEHEDGVNPITVLLTVAFYTLIMLAAWRHDDVYRLCTGGMKLQFPTTFPTLSNLFAPTSNSLTSPYVGHKNASWVAKHRLSLIETDFEAALTSDGWYNLWSGNNVTVEALDNKDGSWPIYVRSLAVFDCKPEALYKLLNGENFDKTQQKVDPFHESTTTLSDSSDTVKIVRKTTKRPLIFPKRDFALALIEKNHQSSFTIKNVKIRTSPMQSITEIKVDRNILMNAMITVNVDDQLLSAFKSKGSYIRAYQDMTGYFVPLKNGGTLLVSMMKVNLGSDIPRFPFKTTLGATVAWSMGTLRTLSNK